MGRPSEYTEEIARTICHRLMEGESLRAICLDKDMPSRGAVYGWLADNPDFVDLYARAREVQADTYADDIVAISDDSSNDYTRGDGDAPVFDAEHVARSRLRIDARKWIAAKLRPRKYGEAHLLKLADADGEKLGLADLLREARKAG